MSLPIIPRSRSIPPNIVVRVTEDEEEIAAANRLVFRNYVEDGFWDNNEAQLDNNRFLSSPARTVCVVFEDGNLIGTMSIILDSSLGLPSDGTQAVLTSHLRKRGTAIAEVSAFAMNRSRCSHRKVVLFLMSFVLQYSFYHAGIDRLIGSCKPEHADFYESILCFSKVSDLTYYDYSRAIGYLISLDLLEAHRLLWQKYPSNPTGESLYRFLLCDPQPCHIFPDRPLQRSRNINWLELSTSKVA